MYSVNRWWHASKLNHYICLIVFHSLTFLGCVRVCVMPHLRLLLLRRLVFLYFITFGCGFLCEHFFRLRVCVSALARSLFGARSDNDDRFSDCLCDNRTLATLADFTSTYTLLGCVSVRGDRDSRTNRAHVWKRKKGSEIYIYENSISIYFVHRSGEEGVGRGERETVLSHIHIHMRTLPTILHKPRRGHNRDCKKRLYSSHTHHIARHGMAWHVGMNVTRIPWGHFSDYLYK